MDDRKPEPGPLLTRRLSAIEALRDPTALRLWNGQSATGDRHVYASRMRFIPAALLAYFERRSWPISAAEERPGEKRNVRLDVGARMRGMWR